MEAMIIIQVDDSVIVISDAVIEVKEIDQRHVNECYRVTARNADRIQWR